MRDSVASGGERERERAERARCGYSSRPKRDETNLHRTLAQVRGYGKENQRRGEPERVSEMRRRPGWKNDEVGVGSAEE